MALGGCLYAIGGMDSPKAGHWGLPLKTVERYDPAQDKWTEITSMNEARFGCAVAAYQVYLQRYTKGQKPTFYPEISNNLMFEIVNFVKNDSWKM